MTDAARGRTIRFDAFEVDVRNEQVRRDGVRIRLHHQPFRLLVVLLEHAGDVVTREELRRELWGSETFVDFDVGLNSTVKKLRVALGDSADVPRFIETVPRVGYRFIAPVTVEPAAMPPDVRNGRSWRWSVIAALLIAAGILATVAFVRRREPVRSRPVRSIAVLPFENLSGDPKQQYFADGITDALTTDLAQLGALRVTSRTSAERVRQLHETLGEAARQLNIDAVVEGTVVASDGRVRVDVRLIEARADRQLWAGSYERDVAEAIDMQADVARGIADAVRLELTPQEKDRLARRLSVDPQTYELYLRGRYFLAKWSDKTSERSIEYFNEALRRDKHYAPAYAGLAAAYIIGREDMPPSEAYPKSEAAAVAALRIDPSLAEAHSVLGMSVFLYDWDWARAEKEFHLAIASNPNDAMAHQWYGQFEKAMGRPNWVLEVRRAHQLDPLSVIVAGAGQFRPNNRNDLALENVHRRLELDPNGPHLYEELGDVYLRMGKFPEAEANYRKAVDISGGEPHFLSYLGYAEALAGKRAEAHEIVRRMEQMAERRYVSPYRIAVVYVGLGENDAAFAWLQKAVDEHSWPVVFLNWSDELKSIRSDPRFAALVQRVGLPR